jgi:hypothetical protein
LSLPDPGLRLGVQQEHPMQANANLMLFKLRLQKRTPGEPAQAVSREALGYRPTPPPIHQGAGLPGRRTDATSRSSSAMSTGLTR